MIGRTLMPALVAYCVLATAGCGSDSGPAPPSPTPSPTLAIPALPPAADHANVAAAQGRGLYPGTMTVSRVVCTEVRTQSAFNVQITGVVAKHLLQVSVLIQPLNGARTYDITQGSHQGGVAITNLTLAGGAWGDAPSPHSTATLTAADGTAGYFDVFATDGGPAAPMRNATPPIIEVAASWRCSTVSAS